MADLDDITADEQAWVVGERFARLEAARNGLIREVRAWQRALGEDSLRRIRREAGEDKEPAASLAVLEALEALDVAEAAAIRAAIAEGRDHG